MRTRETNEEVCAKLPTMAARKTVAARPYLIMQLIISMMMAGGSNASDDIFGTLLLTFSVKDSSSPQNNTAIMNALATFASVPPASLTVNASSAFRSTGTEPRTNLTKVAFNMAVMNLAAPYAVLAGPTAEAELSAAMANINVQYAPKSLQVSAPAWILQTQAVQANDTKSLHMSFTMSGVSLPSLEQLSLREVIASVAGVNYKDVRSLSVSYTVALPTANTSQRLMRKQPVAGGYEILQIVVAVDRDAANSAGLLTSATVTTRLAEQLMSNIGASYNDGSLFIDQRTGFTELDAALGNVMIAMIFGGALIAMILVVGGVLADKHLTNAKMPHSKEVSAATSADNLPGSVPKGKGYWWSAPKTVGNGQNMPWPAMKGESASEQCERANADCQKV